MSLAAVGSSDGMAMIHGGLSQLQEVLSHLAPEQSKGASGWGRLRAKVAGFTPGSSSNSVMQQIRGAVQVMHGLMAAGQPTGRQPSQAGEGGASEGGGHERSCARRILPLLSNHSHGSQLVVALLARSRRD